MNELTGIFEERYADVAAWARNLYDEAAEGFDCSALGAAWAAVEASKGDERSLRRKVYRDLESAEVRRCCVPACYGVDFGDNPTDGMQWHRQGLYNPKAVASFLLGTEPARVGEDSAVILAALVAAKIDCAPPETDSDAQDGGGAGFDALNPESWLKSALLAQIVIRPPESQDAAWAVWMQGVWASMLVRTLGGL